MQYAGLLRRRAAPGPREPASEEPPELSPGVLDEDCGLSLDSVLHPRLPSPLGVQGRGAELLWGEANTTPLLALHPLTRVSLVLHHICCGEPW